MAKIRSKDTKPEIWLRKKLFRQGYRYRKNVNYIPGHPDLWMAKYNTVIFVHGCFWHRHFGCKYAYVPKSREVFWNTKFLKNVERDRKVREQLSELGVRILIIWECTIKKMIKDKQCESITIKQIMDFLNSDNKYLEL